MRFFLCFILAVLGSSAFSQTLVRGTVQDKEGAPVDCFNALILSAADSVFIDGAACFNGSLSVGTKATGKVLLRISALGYEELTRPLLLQGGETAEVGTLTLTPTAEAIDEVVVTARRPAIISKPDRTIVQVEGSILSSAADGTEMLLDRNNNVGVFGKETAAIYIDNRPVRSTAELKMLNPQNIRSIEIIDNPPAAYNAQGNAVILIRTVKSQDHYSVRLGGSFVVSASYNKDVCRWWTTSVYAGLTGSEYKYVDTGGTRRNNNTPYWVLYTTNTFTLPGKLVWDVGFNWTSAGSRGTYYSGSYWNLYTSLRRDFLDGALSCRITANDLFRRSQGTQRSVLPGDKWGLFNADDRYVRLSVTYKFGKSKHQYQSKSGSSTEISRMQ